MSESLDCAARHSSPGVSRFKPPRIFLLCLACGALLEWLRPWGSGLVPGPWPGLALAGFLFMMWGHQRFQRLGVEVKTCRPARPLVDSAAYRFSRNPMYVGMLAMLAGLGLAMDSVWLLLAAAAMGPVPGALHGAPRGALSGRGLWRGVRGLSPEGAAMALGTLAHDLFREVFALRKTLAAVMDEVHARAGLRTPQRRAAGFLEREGPLPVPELARRLEVSRQFARNLCNEMAAAGLLAFSDNPRHRRSRLAAPGRRP